MRALVAVSGATGVLFGYSIAVSNDAIGPLRQHFSLSSLAEGTVVGALLAGALLGCLIASRLSARFGHRRVLALAGIVAALGTAVVAAAPSVAALVAGRLIAGAAVGVTTAVTPIYLVETCRAKARGALIAGYQLAIAVGVLLALTVGAVLSLGDDTWRIMLAANAIPALVQVAAMIPAPSGGHSEAAHERGRAVSLRPFRRAVVIAIGAALMNALVGAGAVVYYSTGVFSIAGIGGRVGAEVASWSAGLVNALATLVAIGLIHRYGRRPLLTVGLTGIVGALVVAACGLLAPASSVTGAVVVAAILTFMACYAFSAGPIAWLLVGEVLPATIRSRVAAIATGLNWSANLFVALLFPVVAGTPGDPGRAAAGFLFFALLSAGFLIFVRHCVPETKGMTLSDIEAQISGTDTKGPSYAHA